MNNDNPRQKYEVKQEVYAIKPRRPEDIISKADLKEKKVVMVWLGLNRFSIIFGDEPLGFITSKVIST